MTKSVALEKCNDYVFEDVFVAIKKLFELVPPPDVKDKIVLQIGRASCRERV